MKSFNLEDWKDKKVVMYCRTEEEAISFCSYLHNHGKKWCSGKLYCDVTNFGVISSTCYNFNVGEFADIESYASLGYTILKWENYTQENKQFFKELPNDFTGYIHIENGYIDKPQILDDIERKYLSSVISPFRGKVIGIQKKRLFNNKHEYIYIKTKASSGGFNGSVLPPFTSCTMYQGMELDKEYTLNELGL